MQERNRRQLYEKSWSQYIDNEGSGDNPDEEDFLSYNDYYTSFFDQEVVSSHAECHISAFALMFYKTNLILTVQIIY